MTIVYEKKKKKKRNRRKGGKGYKKINSNVGEKRVNTSVLEALKRQREKQAAEEVGANEAKKAAKPLEIKGYIWDEKHERYYAKDHKKAKTTSVASPLTVREKSVYKSFSLFQYLRKRRDGTRLRQREKGSELLRLRCPQQKMLTNNMPFNLSNLNRVCFHPSGLSGFAISYDQTRLRCINNWQAQYGGYSCLIGANFSRKREFVAVNDQGGCNKAGAAQIWRIQDMHLRRAMPVSILKVQVGSGGRDPSRSLYCSAFSPRGSRVSTGVSASCKGTLLSFDFGRGELSKLEIPCFKSDVLCQSFSDENSLLNGCRNGTVVELDFRIPKRKSFFERRKSSVFWMKVLDNETSVLVAEANSVNQGIQLCERRKNLRPVLGFAGSTTDYKLNFNPVCDPCETCLYHFVDNKTLSVWDLNSGFLLNNSIFNFGNDKPSTFDITFNLELFSKKTDISRNQAFSSQQFPSKLPLFEKFIPDSNSLLSVWVVGKSGKLYKRDVCCVV